MTPPQIPDAALAVIVRGQPQYAAHTRARFLPHVNDEVMAIVIEAIGDELGDERPRDYKALAAAVWPRVRNIDVGGKTIERHLGQTPMMDIAAIARALLDGRDLKSALLAQRAAIDAFLAQLERRKG